MTILEQFASQIRDQEWWSGFGYWILVAGLAGELVVLALPAHRGKLEKTLSALFAIAVIVGVGFEHVADAKIATLASQEETASGQAIANANARAAIALQQASRLGVNLSNLSSIVGKKTGEANAAIAALSNATERANSEIRHIETPRTISHKMQHEISNRLRRYAGAHFCFGVANDPESVALLRQIGTALELSGWIWQRTPDFNAVLEIPGKQPVAIVSTIGIEVMPFTAIAGQPELAKALRAALKVASIDVENAPTSVVPGPDDGPPYCLLILVGAKS